MRVACGCVALVATLSTACAPATGPGSAGASPGGNDLAPSFGPVATPADDEDRTPGTTDAETPATATETPEPATTPASTPTTPPPADDPPPAELTAALDDPRGDLDPSVEPPPDHADLLGGTLTRRTDGYELRVRLGAEVPERADQDHTLNVASFHDVDGDGHIEFEVWANLADSGWGPAYYDNTEGGGGFGDDSGVRVLTDGPELVLRFPLGHLEGAESLRWALASEWGRYETLSTSASARDAAPDSGAASFPGDDG